VTVAIAVVQQIEAQWRSRARTQGYRPGSQRYQRAELEFIVGAMAAIEATTGEPAPPRWVIAGMRGDPIVPVAPAGGG
jgi:hypothetical protein